LQKKNYTNNISGNILVFICFCLLGFAIGSSSCRPKKEITIKKSSRPKNIQHLLEQVQKNEFAFEWLSIKAGADLHLDGEKKSFNVNIRIRKDSVMWISVSPLLGIEVARVMITQDTVMIIDRINKSFSGHNFSFIDEKLDVDINFNILQAFLVGNSMGFEPQEDDEGDLPKLSMDHHRYLLSTFRKRKLKKMMEKKQERIEKKPEKYDDLVHSIWVMPDTFKIAMQSVVDLKMKRSIAAKYENFLPADDKLFPRKITIEINGEQKGYLLLDITKIATNIPQTFPFKIPEKYESD
jgi:hypothetical protein